MGAVDVFKEKAEQAKDKAAEAKDKASEVKEKFAPAIKDLTDEAGFLAKEAETELKSLTDQAKDIKNGGISSLIKKPAEDDIIALSRKARRKANKLERKAARLERKLRKIEKKQGKHLRKLEKESRKQECRSKKLHNENGTTNDKIHVNECKNDKKRKIVFSFVIILCFLCGKKCRFLSFFWPHSVPQPKICPSILNAKCLIINTF